MTKAKSKSAKTTIKATAVKGSVRKSAIAPATSTSALIVLGFDEQQKPRGAKFVDAKRDLVTKAADLMGFKVYEASPPDVAEVAKKLPLGRLYANGRGFVPNIRQSLCDRLLAQLFRLNKSIFTNKDVQQTFRVGAQSARTRIQSWENAGIIRLTGTQAAEGARGRPVYQYTIVDSRVERAMRRQLFTYSEPVVEEPDFELE
jgi:hypothetical protein